MRIREYYQFIGREIFQQEREDKGHRENRKRDYEEPLGNRKFGDGTYEALTARVIAEE